jgi:hypothetical protein
MASMLILTAILACFGTPVAAIAGCGDKVECRDMSGRGCYEVGIPEEYGAAWCDECGVMYTCGGKPYPPILSKSSFPCSCIDDRGYYIECADNGDPCCYSW